MTIKDYFSLLQERQSIYFDNPIRQIIDFMLCQEFIRTLAQQQNENFVNESSAILNQTCANIDMFLIRIQSEEHALLADYKDVHSNFMSLSKLSIQSYQHHRFIEDDVLNFYKTLIDKIRVSTYNLEQNSRRYEYYARTLTEVKNVTVISQTSANGEVKHKLDWDASNSSAAYIIQQSYSHDKEHFYCLGDITLSCTTTIPIPSTYPINFYDSTERWYYRVSACTLFEQSPWSQPISLS